MRSHQLRPFAVGLLTFALLTTSIDCSKMKMDNYEAAGGSLDRQFVTDAATSNLDEVSAGSLAAAKSTNVGVKGYGQLLAEDHGAAQNELKLIADTINLVLPQTPDSLHQAMQQTLSGLTGKSFDTTWLRAQITDHQKTIVLFQSELKNGTSATVLRYTNKHLPELQAHLKMADSLLQELQ
jgi:putative membrane protein